MKRLLTLLTISTVCLFAYQLGADAWSNYTNFIPTQRAMGLTYPKSWVQPSDILLNPTYDDTTKLHASWEQVYTAKHNYVGNNISNRIMAQYTPSGPKMWSLGLEFVDYNGFNASNRTDLAFNYKHKKGAINYFHTHNKQTIALDSLSITHHIVSNTFNFTQGFGKKFLLLAGLDQYLIQQENDALTNYNSSHEFMELRYVLNKSFQAYGKFEHRFFRNNLQENTMIVFRPGIKYHKGIFFSHLAVRISPSQAFPIAQIMLKPKAFYFEAFLKVRNPVFILKQKGYQYTGLRAGIHLNQKQQSINADVEINYNLISNLMPTPTPNFFIIKAEGEYRYKFRNFDTYFSASYGRSQNTVYFYHPELSTLKTGIHAHTKSDKLHAMFDIDIHASYILHDNPNNVSFNPNTLTYTLISDSDIVGDWKLNLRLKTYLKSFSFGLDISTPIKAGNDLYWHLYEGIYTSSDFIAGNTLYCGFNIHYLW